jgi:hypothetical protein
MKYSAAVITEVQIPLVAFFIGICMILIGQQESSTEGDHATWSSDTVYC